jgi:hypothetical protein
LEHAQNKKHGKYIPDLSTVLLVLDIFMVASVDIIYVCSKYVGIHVLHVRGKVIV